MKTTETHNEQQKKVYNLIIVDESGSMCCIQREALAGMNETIATCQKMQELHPEIEQRLTLITFDSNHFRVHLDNEKAVSAHLLKPGDYDPCAATPLYDAIGKGIAKMNAVTSAGDNVLVTIITDGEENCSEEYTLPMVKNLIEKLKTQGWTFTLIGTDNLDVEGMASEMAIDNNLSFCEDADSTNKMFVKERKARMHFNECLASGMAMPTATYFDDKEE